MIFPVMARKKKICQERLFGKAEKRALGCPHIFYSQAL